jgi:hypothetical protein
MSKFSVFTPDLINKLITIGQETRGGTKKIAQTAPAAQPANPDLSQEKIKAIAQKLVARLASQISPDLAPKDTSPFGSDTGASAPMRNENIKNLESLLDYLATNKIVYNGSRVAYKAGEEGTSRDPGMGPANALYFSLNKAAPEGQEKVKYTGVAYWVFEKPLQAFVNYLQKYAASPEGNEMMVMMIGSIANQINSNPNLKEKIVPGSDTQATSSHDTIDAFNTTDWSVKDVSTLVSEGISVRNTAKPFEGARIPLSMDDLSSKDKLFNWLDRNKISQNKEFNDGKSHTVNETFDPCKALFVLYKKALAYQNPPTSAASYPKWKEHAAYYLKQVTNLTPQFSNENGVCEVNNPNSSSSGQKSDKEGSKLSQDIFDALPNLYPLKDGQLNFKGVNAFATNKFVRKLFEASDSGSAYNEYAKAIYDAASKMTELIGDVGNVKTSQPGDWQGIFKTKLGTNYGAFSTASTNLLSAYKQMLAEMLTIGESNAVKSKGLKVGTLNSDVKAQDNYAERMRAAIDNQFNSFYENQLKTMLGRK